MIRFAAGYGVPIVGLAVAAVAAMDALAVGVGSPAQPGPGLWPLVVAVAMAMAALACGVESYRKQAQPLRVKGDGADGDRSAAGVFDMATEIAQAELDEEAGRIDGRRRFLIAVVSLVIAIAAIPLLGMLVVLFGVMVVWLRWAAEENWRITVVLSAGTVAVIWAIFELALGIRFPLPFGMS